MFMNSRTFVGPNKQIQKYICKSKGTRIETGIESKHMKICLKSQKYKFK